MSLWEHDTINFTTKQHLQEQNQPQATIRQKILQPMHVSDIRKILTVCWLVLSSTNMVATAQDLDPLGYWKSRTACEAEFTNAVEAIIEECENNDLDSDIEIIRKFLIPRDPKRQYVFLPPENQIGNDRFARLSQQTKRHFQIALDEHSKRLFQLATVQAATGNAAWSYQLLNEILFFAPDHPKAREILGHRIVGIDDKTWRVKSDRLRVKRATKPEPKLGWPAKSYWTAATTHFQIVSTAGEDETRELAHKLERWHDVWRQVFFEYYNSQRNLQRWFQGTSKPTPSRRKFKVVFFGNRNAYVSTLQKSIPGIEASTGYYNDSEKQSYFFASTDKSIHDTWRHELTHQLFQESRRCVRNPFRNEFLWLGEGIAMYFESLVNHGDYVVLGGFDTRRLQYARLRRMKEQFRLPLNELSRMNMVQFQSLPDIAKVYSQSAGVTQMLMTSNSGSYQAGLIQFLVAIYQGKSKPHSFTDTIDLSYENIEKKYDQFLRIDASELSFFDTSNVHRELAMIGVKLEKDSLSEWQRLAPIEWIDLSASDVRGQRLSVLQTWKGIGRLFLTGAVLDSATVAILTESPISEIDLSGTSLNDEQFRRLSKSKSIRTINVVGTNVTVNGIKRFELARPDITLVRQTN